MTTTTAPLTAGQHVEVSLRDFKAAGMPLRWVPAVVVSVDPMGKVFDVAYAVESIRNREGGPLVQRTVVGRRLTARSIIRPA